MLARALESGMKTLPIIEHLDVIEHRRFGLRTGTEAAVEAAVMDVLDLERGKDTLHRRVVQAVPASAHGLNDAVPLQHGSIRLSSVLHAAVRMMDQTL